MIAVGLATLLRSTPAVTDIVGTNIYYLIMPEEAPMPALRFQVIGGQSYPTFQNSGLQKQRIQFDCYAVNALQADQLRDALIAFLNQFRGVLSDGTNLQYAEYIQSVDFYEYQAAECRLMCEFYLLFTTAS